jgi:hypothetical protein
MAVEQIRHHGKQWTRVTRDPVHHFVMGLDLAQSMDFTAICVVEFNRVPQRDDWLMNYDSNVARQRVAETFDVVFLERLKRGTAYPDIVKHVETLMARNPLKEIGCDLFIDASGVGTPVFDAFGRDTYLKPIGVTITAGDGFTKKSNRYNVSKLHLVSGLDGKYSAGQLRFNKALPDVDTLIDELKVFTRNRSDSGRATFAASGSFHDDYVMALAIALFGCDRYSDRHGYGASVVRGMI